VVRNRAYLIGNHFHVSGTEFVGTVSHGLFVSAQSHEIAGRKVGPDHGFDLLSIAD
jgi:hypothetical protein